MEGDKAKTPYSNLPATGSHKYRQVQCGTLFLYTLIMGILLCAVNTYLIVVSHFYYDAWLYGFGIWLILTSLAIVYVEIKDYGEYMQIRMGPLTKILCGCSTETIYYKDITHYDVTRVCTYGLRYDMDGVKKMAVCSPKCEQTLFRISIKEKARCPDSCGCCCCFNGNCVIVSTNDPQGLKRLL
eukprot:407863_1